MKTQKGRREETTKTPFVEILIVGYNGIDYLKNCIASLHALAYPHERYIITVVDNASQDGTVDFLKSSYPDVKVIANKRNLGFGKANNIGIAQASSQARYITLLNQDSLVDKFWLRELVAVMEGHPKAGACGATEKAYSLYRRGETGKHYIKDCLWMGGGSVIFRKQALDDIKWREHYFDPFYFMYIEDIDLTLRLRIAGWKILHTYNALWFHDGRKRPLTYGNKRLYWAWKNRIYLLFKFCSWKQIFTSLQMYASSFVSRKQNEKEDKKQGKIKQDDKQEVIKQDNKAYSTKLQKTLFIMKLFFAVIYTIPYALVQRRALRRKYVAQQEEIDQTMQYLDRVLFGLED